MFTITCIGMVIKRAMTDVLQVRLRPPIKLAIEAINGLTAVRMTTPQVKSHIIYLHIKYAI